MSRHQGPSTAGGVDREDAVEPSGLPPWLLGFDLLLERAGTAPSSLLPGPTLPLQLSQTAAQLSDHGGKEVASGCPLGPQASRPSERRGANHPNGVTRSLKGCPTPPQGQ